MKTENSTSVPVARMESVVLRYGKTIALDGITLDLPSGRMVGLIGPDAVGKSSVLSLLAGAVERSVSQHNVHSDG